MNFKTMVTGFALTLAATSCSSGGSSNAGGVDGGGGGGGSVTSVSGFCAQVIQAVAATEASCVGGTSQEWASMIAPTFCADMEAAVTAGRITFGASTAASCLAALQTVGCDSNGLPSACATTLVGTVAVGSPCASNADCAGTGSTCNLATNGTCGGTCQAGAVAAPAPVAALGQPCGKSVSNSPVCGAMQVCTSTPPVCTAIVRAGAACTPGLEQCEYFTYCSSTTKTCTADPTTVGATCGVQSGADYIPCLAPTYCAMGNTGAGTCAASLALGATCTIGDQCASSNCGGIATAGGSGACGAVCPQF